ncbi:MAG TPA: cation:proton antiporter [Terriglobia bacterium]|nr:cation:proton antiporter [Terriglobia bacterium]
MALIAADATQLPLAMLMVFGTAKLLSELFEHFGQPGIVAEILAGILLGPHVLGWVEPNELIVAFAELGVMFLLFRVGLEVKASEFIRVGYTAAIIALLGVILPFIAGWLLATAFHHESIESVFVGAAMVATSVGITARFLASKGLLQARASRIILAAAVIDDVLGLIVLAVVTSIARGNVNVAQLTLTAVLALGFIVMVVRWGTRAMGAILPQISQKLRSGEGQFTLAMCLLFGLSVLSIYAGVAAIIGAFLAGMALAETVDRRVHDLTNGVAELFTPFFLVGIGLRFNFTAFANVSTVVFAIVILLAAILSKVVGCGLPAIKGGKRDALRIGIGMIPRGEVGMVVAQIGLAMSVISDRVFGVVVFMSVMTTLISPPLLNWAYKDVKAQAAIETRFRIG